MRFETGQHLQAGQQMRLAPRIIQTMEIMQLPLPALEEKLEQELASNIALELIEPEQVDEGEQGSSESESEDEFSRLEEFENQTGADFSDRPPRTAASSDGRDAKHDLMANLRSRQESLSEQLQHQWTFAEVEDDIMEAGKILIDIIDPDGYLSTPEKEMQILVQGKRADEEAAKLLQETVFALQHWLDPSGMAARTLQESLLLQIEELRTDDLEGWKDVQTLIESHLDKLIDNRLPQVATSSGIGLERVKAAIEKMHELSLSPGKLLVADRVLPVIPDAIIDFEEETNQYVVSVCDGHLPPLKISTAYDEITKDNSTDERTKQFVQRNVNAARWIIEAVGQRRATIGNIVQVVTERQRDFLDQGDAFLRPLPMIEVADMLGIHVATVSRAVADKWIQTPRGIFPLRRFFSGGTGSSSDGDMSWQAIKSRLQEIVNEEDKKHPLSDESLAKELRDQGIMIARRTVVKYRQQLGIPAARLRREY